MSPFPTPTFLLPYVVQLDIKWDIECHIEPIPAHLAVVSIGTERKHRFRVAPQAYQDRQCLLIWLEFLGRAVLGETLDPVFSDSEYQILGTGTLDFSERELRRELYWIEMLIVIWSFDVLRERVPSEIGPILLEMAEPKRLQGFLDQLAAVASYDERLMITIDLLRQCASIQRAASLFETPPLSTEDFTKVCLKARELGQFNFDMSKVGLFLTDVQQLPPDKVEACSQLETCVQRLLTLLHRPVQMRLDDIHGINVWHFEDVSHTTN